MAASHAEQILKALEKLLTSAAPVIRNAALAEQVSEGGLIVLRDGNPQLTDPTLGGVGGILL